MSVEQAIQTLKAAGVVVFREPTGRSVTLPEAAALLSFSQKWVREHLELFPNAWRAPGGGANGGEIRIPSADLERFEAQQRIQR